MKNSLARRVIHTFSTQVGSQVVPVLAGVLIARTIGPSAKAFFSYAGTTVKLVAVFFLGFGDAVMFQFGKQKLPARAVHAAVMRVVICVLAVVIPLFLIIAYVVPSQRPLAAAAAMLPFAIYTQLTTPLLLVREKIAFLNIRTIAQSLGTARVTVALLLFTNTGITAVLGAWLLFGAVAALQSAWGVAPILASSEAGTRASEIVGEQVRFGSRAAGASVAGFLNTRIDIFVVSIMFAPATLGWYTLAIASGELMWQVSRAFVWPALGRIGSDSFDDSTALVARLTRNTLTIVGCLGIVAFITGPWLIVHVCGAAFTPSGSALRWALPGLVAYAAEVALTNFINLRLQRPLAIVWVQSVSAALCAGLTFATAARFGIVGAAAATSLTYLMATVVLIVLFVRRTGIAPQRLLLVQREDFRHYADLLKGMLPTLRLRSA
jgi:O-antigen/teichoic acid export membrane protein